MGLGAEQQDSAELSALLHDVGKIAVPDSILNKPGRLTAEEFAEMRKHPVHGARILANIQSALVVGGAAGRPVSPREVGRLRVSRGPQRQRIPLLGRLLGVADFLDALTSARAYHAADANSTKSSQLIAQGAGVHFDPEIADAVVRLHARGALNVE